jgi:nitrite reductase (NADH) small subunit
MPSHEIGTVAEFPEGRGTKVEVQGIEIAVFNIDGDLYGITNTCPHKRYPLHRIGEPLRLSESREDVDEKPRKTRGLIDEENCTIACEWHMMEFSLENGENEAVGLTAATFDLEVDDDGMVTLEL